MKVATLALVLHRDEVLLGLKGKAEIGTGTLNGPGGKQEEGETLEECLVRECMEEVGISPTEYTKIAIVTFFVGGVPDFEVHIYRVRAFEGEPQATSEMTEVGWYPINALPFDRMLESDKDWFVRALSGPSFRAHVYYRERAKGFERIEFFEADF